MPTRRFSFSKARCAIFGYHLKSKSRNPSLFGAVTAFGVY
jgi:hypothetical protein